MHNPFLKNAFDTQKTNRLVIENQRRINQISQPYFHEKVYKKEHPEYLKEIYKGVSKLSEPLETLAKPFKDEFVSKQLYNRRELVNQAMMSLEDRQATSFNRKIPALTPTTVVKGKQTGQYHQIFIPEGKQVSLIPRTRRRGGPKIQEQLTSNEGMNLGEVANVPGLVQTTMT